MFTGLITEIGVVRTSVDKGRSSIVIDSSSCVRGIKTGDSIACSGVCLTVTECAHEWFSCDVSSETLSCTTVGNWKNGSKVNLERSLKVGDELGGHFVSGHVDGIAYIVERQVVGESIIFCCESPFELKNFIAPKGAVALDGVSLTVNESDKNRFWVNIIPYTAEHTTFGMLQVRDSINLEVDILSKYVVNNLNSLGISREL